MNNTPKLIDGETKQMLWGMGIEAKFESVRQIMKSWGSDKPRPAYEVVMSFRQRTPPHKTEFFTAYFGAAYKEVSIKEVLCIFLREHLDIYNLTVVDLLDGDLLGTDMFEAVNTAKKMYADATRLAGVLGYENLNKLIEYYREEDEL